MVEFQTVIPDGSLSGFNSEAFDKIPETSPQQVTELLAPGLDSATHAQNDGAILGAHGNGSRGFETLRSSPPGSSTIREANRWGGADGKPVTGSVPRLGGAGTQTAAIKAILFPATAKAPEGVRIVDIPEPRLHHPSNVVKMVAAALGIGLVLLLAVYAHSTTTGVSEDFIRFTGPLATLLRGPVNLLEGLLTIVVPLAVLVELAIQRQVRQAVESIGAAVVAFATAWAASLLIQEVGGPTLIAGLSVRMAVAPEVWALSIPAYLAAITALLVVAGPSSRRVSVKWAWRLLVVTVLILVTTSQVSATGVGVTLLIGSLIAHATQYSAGVRSERAYGPELVAAIERAGWRPRALIRVADRGTAGLNSISDVIEAPDLGSDPTVLEVREASELPVEMAEAVITSSSDSTATALARSARTRIYAMLADDGLRYDVEMLDGDRQVPSFVQRLWRVVRLRGVGTRAVFSLKAATERTALLSFATTAAGVRTPRLLGVGMADDSAALIFEHLGAASSLRDLPASAFEGAAGDALMADVWRQLLAAHRAGLAHHQLGPDVILVRGADTTEPQAWIAGWEHGEIAASQLSKRLDLVQLLALFALRVGPERALASASTALPESELAAIGPLLQTVALPPETQASVRKQRGLLPSMRAALAERLPEIDFQAAADQQRIARFTPRTLIMFAVTIIAVAVILTTINFQQIQAAITGADPYWVAIAAAFSLLTWLGAALTLTSFTPNKLPLGRTVLAQMAGNFVALATPAGIGPAALNMRYLNRKGVPTATGLAVVALMQTSQIVVTVLMLLVLSLTTGTGGLIMLPSTTILVALLLVLVVAVALMLVPPIRAFVWSKIAPTLRQLWPRLSEMLSQPSRLALGLGGNLLMSLGYVMAFSGALRAFGHSMNLIDVAVIYLVGNTLGAIIPTPGGLGGVEGALIAGLTAAGIPVVISTTVTLLFRLITYWFRIPIGWVAMRYLQSRHEI